MMRQELAKEIIRLRTEGQTIAYIAATLNLAPAQLNPTSGAPKASALSVISL